MTVRIGDLALAAGAVTAVQLEQARAVQKAHGSRLGAALVSLGFVTEEQVADLVAKHYGLPVVNDLDTLDVRPDVLVLVDREHCRSHCVLPLSRQGAQLQMAMADPTNAFAVDSIQFKTGLRVRPLVAAEGAILRAVTRLYGEDKGLQPVEGASGHGRGAQEAEVAAELDPTDIAIEGADIDADSLGDDADVEQVPVGPEEIDLASLTRGSTDRPVVALVNKILVEAYRRGASDIHIEPYEKEFCIRFRVDGVLTEFRNLSPRVRETVTTRVKIMANLDIAERRLPQGGRIKIRIRQDERVRDLDFRVSCLPTLWGEKIVLRGINQVQIREAVGLTFAVALREFLRQDPNIILVGEIRDYETAEIAVKAALTGHLVLSTLHTNDAPSSISRLVNMGIEPFLVGTGVNLIQAQRLVRRLCPQCKAEATKDIHSQSLVEAGFDRQEVPSLRIYRGRGCRACNGTGYKGRVGLYEVMEMTESIRDLVMVGATAVEIKRKALEEGMLTLRMSGLEKIRQGITSLEEVLRETVR